MKKSIQLYSLREKIADEGPNAVLAAVKAAGFDGVETAGFYGMTFAAFKKMLDGYGLIVTGTHTALDEILNTPDTVAEMAKTLNTRNVIIPWVSPERLADDMTGLSADIRTAVAWGKANGITIGYHNHSFEFDGGDRLGELLDAVPGLKSELDVFWLAAAGGDIRGYYHKHAGRFLTFHIKELSKKGKDDFNPELGRGVAGLKEALRFARTAGFSEVVLEVENFGIPYTDYLKSAAAFMEKEIHA